MIDETPQDDSATVDDTTDDAAPDDAAPENPNHEAARYRVKLREAETERDELATRLANMQRSQVDSHITAMGIKPAAVWASGVELADLLDENGVPDEKAIADAITVARNTLGIETAKRLL